MSSLNKNAMKKREINDKEKTNNKKYTNSQIEKRA